MPKELQQEFSNEKKGNSSIWIPHQSEFIKPKFSSKFRVEDYCMLCPDKLLPPHNNTNNNNTCFAAGKNQSLNCDLSLTSAAHLAGGKGSLCSPPPSPPSSTVWSRALSYAERREKTSADVAGQDSAFFVLM